MTQEDKQLLFTDLCARLPYGVYVKDINKGTKVCKIHEMKPSNTYCLTLIPISDSHHYQVYSCGIDSVRPYLRPLSSMTEEEKRELQSFFPGSFGNQWLDVEAGYIDIYECESTIRLYLYDANRLIDWLNKKMFDYRGLIPIGCALSTEAFNPY